MTVVKKTVNLQAKKNKKFKEYLNYPQNELQIGNLVPAIMAEDIIHKAVNINGGYEILDKRLRSNKVREQTESEQQFKTVYGRTYVNFFEKIMHKLFEEYNLTQTKTKVKRTPSFIDLGSGMGTLVFYFALRTGYYSTGIELNEASFVISQTLRKYIDIFLEEKKPSATKDNIQLFQGNLFDKKFVPLIKQHTILFMNNAHDTFSCRSVPIGSETLDDVIVNIFLEMERGTQLVSFEKLIKLHQYSEEVKVVKLFSGRGETSWTFVTNKKVTVYIYKMETNFWLCPSCFIRNSLLVYSCKTRNCRGSVIRSKGYALREHPMRESSKEEKSGKQNRLDFKRKRNSLTDSFTVHKGQRTLTKDGGF